MPQALLLIALLGQLPPTYSFSETNSLMVPNLMLKVYRDGAKELIDQTRAPDKDMPRGFHLKSLYDFQTHKLYAWDLIEPARPCSVSDYPDAAAPPETDIVSGSASLLADLEHLHPKPAGNETIDGVATHVLDATDAGGGRIRLWLSDRTNYIIRWVNTPKGGRPDVQIEVKDLSFAAPPAAVFAMPAGCQ